MKKLLFITVWILFLAGGVHAQQLVYNYGYDDAGNRIRRRVVSLIRDGTPDLTDGQRDNSAAVDDGSLRLYPNPTRGEVIVETSDGSDLVRYRLSDATGKFSETGSIGSPSLRIDLSNRPDGIYLLEVVLEIGRKYYKIIKQQ